MGREPEEEAEDIEEHDMSEGFYYLVESYAKAIMRSHKQAMKLLPERNAVKTACALLVGTDSYHAASTDALIDYLDTEVEDLLVTRGVDVVKIMIEFALRDEEYPMTVNLDTLQHIIAKYKDSAERVRRALLDVRTQRWADGAREGRTEPVKLEDQLCTAIGDELIWKGDHKYVEELMETLGDIGSLAIIGESAFLKRLPEEEEGGVLTQRDRAKYSEPNSPEAVPSMRFVKYIRKRPDVAKALKLMNGLGEEERRRKIMMGLKHAHPRPRAGASWYVWLTGTKSSEILGELKRIVALFPDDEIASAALAKLSQ